MVGVENFKDIENYERVYVDRNLDYVTVKRANRKAMTMHLGGIYLECLLKNLIIKKKQIVKAKTVTGNVNGQKPRRITYWYNDVNYKKLEGLQEPSPDDYEKNKNGYNPEHDLLRALRQISILNRELSNIPNGIQKLEMLNKPINNKSYIDIRYICDDDIAENVYNEWVDNFDFFDRFLNSMRKRLLI